MRSIHFSQRTVVFLGAIVVTLLGAACAERDDPFDLRELDGRQAAAGSPVATSPAGQVPGIPTPVTDYTGSLPSVGKGTIKFGDWKNSAVNLENMIAGYIMVWGYDYQVELIDVNEPGYQPALAKGDVDVVMEVAKAESADWYKTNTESGVLTDVGNLFESKPDIRIGVHASMNQRAPELVDFLGNMTTDEKVIADLASRITGGRTGIRSNVVALMFLKRHQDVWTQWMPEAIAEKVDAAIKAGKSSLLNRKCMAAGGSGGVGSEVCSGKH